MFEAAPLLVNHARSLAALLGQNVITAVWQLLVPGVCGLCGGAGQWQRCRGGLDLCEHCEAALPRLAVPWTLLSPDVALLAPFEFRPPADFLVRQLKFAGDRTGARTLGLLLAEARRVVRAPLPHELVPVPLHRSRLRERGYNQAQELAVFAGRALGVRVASRRLVRTRATQAQSSLPAAQRRGNVEGCFEVVGAMPQGRRVALVDDVLTTGSTIEEAVMCLRAAGAGEIEVWVACRAGRRTAKSAAPSGGSDHQNVSFTPA